MLAIITFTQPATPIPPGNRWRFDFFSPRADGAYFSACISFQAHAVDLFFAVNQFFLLGYFSCPAIAKRAGTWAPSILAFFFFTTPALGKRDNHVHHHYPLPTAGHEQQVYRRWARLRVNLPLWLRMQLAC
jgi:hypothetical protein